MEKTGIKKEIERRFLVDLDVARKQSEKAKPYYIEQSYLLNSGDWGIRSRMKMKDGKKVYTLTMKRKTGYGEFDEIETEVAQEIHEQIKASTGKGLGKARTGIKLASGHILELDIFHDHKVMPNYAIAEIEMSSIDEEVALPEWLGEEITGKKEYSNMSLFLKL